MKGPPIAALTAWASQTLGSDVRLDLIPGGGSRTSFVVRASDARKYILRLDNGDGPLSGTRFTLEREHRVISALGDAGPRVPGIIAYSAAHNAMLMEFVDGATHYQATPDPERQAHIQRDLMRQIAKLHALRPDEIGLSDFAAFGTIRSALEHDLATLAEMYGRPATPKDPVIDFALHWLADHIPDPEGRACLVHGDIGPGNFLFDEEGRVTALLDWEVVHMGHPLEDVAAILCRSLGAPFGTALDHVRNYEDVRGGAIDRRSLDAMVILVLTRWYVGLNLGLSHPSINQNLAVILSFRQSVAYTLACMLAKVHGIDVLPLRRGTERTADGGIPLHDFIVHGLEAVIGPTLSDPYLVERAKGLAALARYLRDLDAVGTERLAREEREAIEVLLGARFPDRETAIDAACQAARTMRGNEAVGLVNCMLAFATRRQRIWADAMGEMAYRRMDY
ncbi:phosphotransferase family protein [Sphingomonas sp. YL-JM2C]